MILNLAQSAATQHIWVLPCTVLNSVRRGMWRKTDQHIKSNQSVKQWTFPLQMPTVCED